MMRILDLPLLLDFTICVQVTLKGLWVKKFPTMKGTSSLPFFSSYGLFVFWFFLAFLFCLPCDGSGHWFFILFFFLYNPKSHTPYISKKFGLVKPKHLPKTPLNFSKVVLRYKSLLGTTNFTTIKLSMGESYHIGTLWPLQ